MKSRAPAGMTSRRRVRSIHRDASQRRRQLVCETLEARRLLAFDGVAPLFTTDGTVGAGDAAEVALRFSGGRDSAVLGFRVTATDGGFDPSAATVGQGSSTIAPLVAMDDAGTPEESYSLVRVPLANRSADGTIDFQIMVDGDRGTSGGFTLDVFLVGDAGGDGTVSDFELLKTTAAVTQYLGAGNLVTQEYFRSRGIDFSQDQRSAEMDADINSIVDGFDLTQVEINHGKPAIGIVVADGVSVSESFTLADTNGNGRADLGESLVFAYSVTNTGSTQLSGVTLTDDLNGNLSLSDVFGDGAAVLAPGQTETATSTRIVNQTDLNNRTILTGASVTATPPGRDPITATPAVLAPVVLINPSIQVTNSANLDDQNGNGRGDIGETITYQFSVTNTGNDPLANVTLSDTLDGVLALSDGGGDGASVLASGATETSTSIHTITAAEFNSGSLTNLATVAGTPTQGTAVTASASATVTFFFAAITVDKSFGLTGDVNANGRADIGDSITYSYSVANTGNVGLSGVTLVDDIEGTLVLSDVAGDSVGTLAPGANETATSVHVVTAAEFAAGSLTNIATVAGNSALAGMVSDTDTATVTFSLPAISIVKTSTLTTDLNNNNAADVGDVVTYQYTVTNTGDTTLQSVVVNDDQEGIIVLGDNGGDGPGVLAPGAAETGSAVRTISQADFSLGSLTNTATATATPPIGNPVTAQDSVTIAFVQPSIAVVKTSALTTDVNSNGRPDVGDIITYSYSVTNTGDVDLANVSLVDDVEGTLTLTDAAGDGVTVLAVGATETSSSPHTITAAEFAAGSLTNIATASGVPSVGSTVTATDTVTVNFVTPAITVVKTAALTGDVNGNGRIDAGDTVTYSYVVTNSGDAPLASVSVVDDVEGTLVLADLGGDGAQMLAPGASENATATRVISPAEFAAGSLTNNVVVSGSPPIGTAVSGSDSATITFISPAITINKTFALTADNDSNGRADAGDQVTYTFTVTNTGDATLSSLTLVDDVEGTLVLSDAGGDGVAVLTPGTTETATSIRTITAGDVAAGSLTNIATVTASPPIGNDVSASDTATVNFPIATIDVVKTFAITTDVNNNSRADQGDVITYTFQVTNTGTVPLSGVTVVDDIEGTLVLGDLAGDGSGTLAVGATESVTSPHVVTAAEFAAGSLTNIVVVTGTPPVGTNAVDQATLTVPLGSPAITVDKSSALTTDVNGNNIADFEDVITYTFVVTNSGNVPLTGVTLVDDVDGPITLADVAGDGVGVLAAGASEMGTFAHTITRAEINSGTLVNIATAMGTSPGGDVVTGTDTETFDLCMNATVDQTMTLVDVDGNPITGPITAGSMFGIEVRFEDLTREGSQGAISGFADISFDPTLVQVDRIVNGPDYDANSNLIGTIDNTLGLIDEFGFRDGITPPDNNLVFTIFLTAVAGNSGTAPFISSSTSDPGNRTAVTVSGIFEAQNSLTCYRGLDVQIVQAAENEMLALTSPMDTNGTGSVTALDALLIINRLGRQSSEGLTVDDPSLDVNGDGQVSARDALNIINFLGRTSNAVSEAEQLAAVDQVFEGFDDTDSDTEDEFFGELPLIF